MSRREAGHRLALVLLGTLVGFGLAELTLRLTLFGSPRYYVWPPGLVRVLRPAPGLMVGIHGEARFTINSAGIRGDEFAEDPQFRVLAVGGSTTECLYLDDTEAWPHLLQRSLRQRTDGARVWVGNVGRSGLASRNHVLELKYLLPQYPRIDAVLVLVGVNDFLLRLRSGSHYDPFALERPSGEAELVPDTFSVFPLGVQNRHRPFFTRSALWRLASRVGRQEQRSFQDETGAVYERQREARRRAAKIAEPPDLRSSLDEYARNLERMIEATRHSGARLVFATQPVLWREDLSPEMESLLCFGRLGGDDTRYLAVPALAAAMERYNETVRAVGRHHGVQVIDLAARLPRDTSVFFDDFHFNESGARLVTAALTETLAPLLPGPTAPGDRKGIR